MWQTVKQITNTQKQVPPCLITHNNIVITKISEIANIANQYFISKMNNIRSKFSINIKISPISKLQFLIPENTNKFHLP